MTDDDRPAVSDPTETSSKTAATDPAATDPAGSTDPAATDPAGSVGPDGGPIVSDGGPIAVLHVEPDPRSAELLAAFAERVSDRLSVRSVDRLDAAYNAVDGADCVITEQRLPDGSGVELVERLRREGRTLPVVFHTTCREAGAEARAFGAGADAYFEKRSERGQYDRLLDRLVSIMADRRSRPSATTAAGGFTETARSEE